MTTLQVRRCWPLVFAAALIFRPAGVQGDAGSGSPPESTLRLANGDFVTGRLRESGRPDVLRWQKHPFCRALGLRPS